MIVYLRFRDCMRSIKVYTSNSRIVGVHISTMHSRWASLCGLLALSTSAYADCSSLGPDASDAYSATPTFNLQATEIATGVAHKLYLLAFETIPGVSYHILSVSQ